MADHTSGVRADVELRLPADGAYASVVRTTAAGLAARLDFTIDDIEDLRIAIGEAGTRAPRGRPGHGPDGPLPPRGEVADGRGLETDAIDDPQPDPESFAWQVLDTMAHDAVGEFREGSVPRPLHDDIPGGCGDDGCRALR